MKKICIFIAGTKGGIGKSFFAMQAAAAAEDQGLSLKVYDSDTENHTLRNFFGKKATYQDDAHTSYPLDAVINGLVLPDSADVTLVDMKAGTSKDSRYWFDSVPWEEQDTSELEIVIAGCFTSDPDSVKTFIPWVRYFTKLEFPVKYLLVQNFKDGNNFDSFQVLQDLFQQMKVTFDLVKFRAMERSYISALNLKTIPLRSLVKGENTTIQQTLMERSRVRRDYQSYTDPLIEIFARYLDKSKITDQQKSLLQETTKRLMVAEEKGV